MSNIIKKSDIVVPLDEMVASGDLFAACPICKQYLNYNEYKLCHCNKCKKIKFDKILYYPGVNKDNN